MHQPVEVVGHVRRSFFGVEPNQFVATLVPLALAVGAEPGQVQDVVILVQLCGHTLVAHVVQRHAGGRSAVSVGGMPGLRLRLPEIHWPGPLPRLQSLQATQNLQMIASNVFSKNKSSA